MTYLPRHLGETLRRAMSTFPAVLVTGARQTGKTTLLRETCAETHAYVSLERPDVRERARADPVGFLDDLGGPAILDEIQHVPELLSYIKDRIDRDRSAGRWLLTGSQTFPLMDGVSQTLAGRVAVLTLPPLSVAEAHGRRAPESLGAVLERLFGPVGEPARVDLADWLLRGGFPELRARPEVDRVLWMSSYVQTYLERDVRDLAQVADLDTFRQFLFLVAARTGQIVNMAAVGREIGVTGPTVRRWTTVLQASGVVVLVPPYHRNLGKRIRRRPKLYLTDPGLATYMLGLHDASAVMGGPSLGPLVETAVVGEWLKCCSALGERPAISFWSSALAEVDLVIETGGQVYGIEVKASATPRPRHAAGLQRWMELTGDDVRGALACQVDRSMSLVPGIRAIPWHLLG